MDPPTYIYRGKPWSRCPTVSDNDSFFHSAFGKRIDETGPYFDKHAKFRRMRWATFLTYFENEIMPFRLTDVLKKCLSENAKYRDTSTDGKQNFARYIFDVMTNEQAVTKEDIPILATLESTIVVVLQEGTPTVIGPDLNILGSYPKETPKEKPKEVVLCFEGKTFARLEPVNEVHSPKSHRDEERKTNPSRYRKRGSAGSKGVEYQVRLLALVMLNALKNELSVWKLSTENEDAGKFDDIVVEWSGGAVLIQSKHKEDDNKKITLEELTSTNSKNDHFSLPKYFLSYMSIKDKFEVENVVICTNASIHERALKCLTYQEANTDSLLHCEDDHCSFYTFNDAFVSYLKEKTFQYYQQHFKNKNLEESVITDKNLRDFLKQLQLYFNYLPLKTLEKATEKLLSLTKHCSNSQGKTTSSEMLPKVMDWFQHKEGVYFTEIHAKAMFVEIWRDKFCQKLEEYKVTLEKNDLDFQDPKQIFYVEVKDGYLLELIKIYSALHANKAKILYVNPDDGIEAQKQVVEAFELPQYAFLVIIGHTTTEESATLETYGKLKGLLETYKYKKVILIAKDNKLVQRIGFNGTVQVDASVRFEDLSYDSREMLVKEKNIVFQGKNISLEELLSVEDYGVAIDSRTLQRLVTRKEIKVGTPLSDLDQHTSQYYINRTFSRTLKKPNEKCNPNEEVESLDEPEDEVWVEETFSESTIFDVDEKLVFISDGAGMGKSTVLIKAESAIKENHPDLWVVRIILNDFTRVLGDSLETRRPTLTVMELLDSKSETKLTNHLEKYVFSARQKVVLMLDAIDEVSPDYTQIILSMIQQCQEQSNFVKIFITTRPHVTKELEAVLKVKPFILKQFTEQNQVDFLTNYWAHNLEIQDDASKEKYKLYAKQVIRNISWTNFDNTEDHFASIPLHVRMAAEIFQDTIGEKSVSNLVKKIDVIELYDLFFNKKWDIFHKKENPDKKTWANEALKKQFDKYRVYHRNLAVEMIVDKDKLRYFSDYQQSDKYTESSLFKIGIAQRFNGKTHFIHRTFADYFFADCLLKELQRNEIFEFHTFLIHMIFLRSQYNVTRIFFDSLLEKVIHSLPSRIFETVKQESILESSKLQSKLIYLLAEEGLVTILRFLLKCIDVKITRDGTVNDLHRDVRRDAVGNTLNASEDLTCISKGQFRFNLRDKKGQTPLHLAALKGCTDMVRFLTAEVYQDNNLKQLLVDAYIKDDNGSTALHLAAWCGQLDNVKFLVDYGVPLNDTDNHGRTPLHIASANSHLETVKFLLESGADRYIKNGSSNTALHAAASFGELDIVKLLIDHGLDFNERGFRSRTPLHLASAKGHLETVKYLLALGADLQIRDSGGYTALHVAASCGQLDTVRFLVEYGLDFNVTSKNKRTPLHLASANGHLETVRFLFEIGVDCNIKNENSNTALHTAASYGQLDIVRLLVSHGLDFNEPGFRGRTPLHLASAKGHLELVKVLLEFGAVLGIRDDGGCTAKDVAASCKKLDTVKFFEEYDPDFNVVKDNNHT